MPRKIFRISITLSVIFIFGFFSFSAGGERAFAQTPPPAIAVTSPADGASFKPGSNIEFIVTLSGDYSSYESGGYKINFTMADKSEFDAHPNTAPRTVFCTSYSKSAFPNVCFLNNAPAGQYAINAVVRDNINDNYITNSSFIYINVSANGNNSISLKPTVSIYADPKIVDYKKSSNITWNSIGAVGCHATNLYSEGSESDVDAFSPLGGVETGPLKKDTIITIFCKNKTGVAGDPSSVTVKVNSLAPVITKFSASSPSSKTSGSSIKVTSGSSVTLSWASTGALYCRGEGDKAWTGTKQDTSGSETLNDITEDKSYALVCVNQAADLSTQESPAKYITVTVSGSGGGNDGKKSGTSGPTRLVPCTDKCGWNDFITLVNNVINFILIDLAVPFAAIMFAYAGGLLMFSGGEVSKREQAKKIIINVAIGLAVIAGAWIIVHTVFSILGYDASWIGF